MNIITPQPLGLGIYKKSNNSLYEAKNTTIHLNPYERKILMFYVYGTLISSSSFLTINVNLEQLLDTNSVKVAFKPNESISREWYKSDSIVVSSSDPIPVYIEITNKFYTELNVNLIVNLSIYSGETLQDMGYYNLIDNNGYKVLDREVETNPDRHINIVTPNYRYLLYSNGESFILLDDGSAIPYQAPESSIVGSPNSILMDAGYYMYDDGYVVDWDTSVYNPANYTGYIATDSGQAITSDDGTTYE